MSEQPGWIVHAISLQETNRMDYRHLTDRGFGIICRINWGWHDHGSIPAMEMYEEFSKLAGAFVRNTQGCNIFIIGNEFNRPEENRGTVVKPEDAAICHRLVYRIIKDSRPESKVLVAAMAPWDNRSGDWLNYQARLAVAVGEDADGYALHAYTHGPDPALIYSWEVVHGWLWHFKTYQQQIKNIVQAYPSAGRLEFHITECNQGDKAWENVNSGYIKSAVHYAHDENQKSIALREPTVRSLSFYRWKRYDHDQWGIEGKSGCEDDFRSAAALGLPTTNPVVIPSLPTPSGGQDTTMAPSDTDLQWDERLTQRHVTRTTPPGLKDGDEYWKITKAYWLPEGSGPGTSGGRHHIYVTTRSPKGEVIGGIPFKVVWPDLVDPDGEHRDVTKNDDGIDGGNYPMNQSLNEYFVWIDDGRPSEVLGRVGMGSDGNKKIHTSTVCEWTLSKYRATSGTETPGADYQYVIAPAGGNIRSEPSLSSTVIKSVPYGEKVEILSHPVGSSWFEVKYQSFRGWMHDSVISKDPREPYESPPQIPSDPNPPDRPPVEGDGWERVKAFTKAWEGGYQNLHWDIGNWTGCAVGEGVQKGTNYGISACSYPDLDIKNLTKEEAEAIFFRDYWLASGANDLSWPLNLLVFDTAVNFHPKTAKKWLAESEGDPLHFIMLRLRGYRKSQSWPQAGNAWVDRIIDLGLEASSK